MYRKWEDPLIRKEREAERQAKFEAKENGGEKKSWRELDALREGKGPREVVMNRGSSGGGRPRGIENTQAYRSYKSNLDRMFEGKLKTSSDGPVVQTVSRGSMSAGSGTVGRVASSASHAKQVKVETLAVSPALSAPATPKEALRLADSDETILAATDACLNNGGIPMDADLIAKALTLKQERYLIPAMEALLDLMERGRPKNAKVLVQRLVEAHDFLSAAHALDLARGLRVRLGDATAA